MQINLLYFDGCPSWKAALANLKVALLAEGLEATVRLVKLQTDEEASRWKFLGSPSFQVTGVDMWAEERQQYSLSCRIYRTPHGMKRLPSPEMFQEKLRALHVEM